MTAPQTYSIFKRERATQRSGQIFFVVRMLAQLMSRHSDPRRSEDP